MNNEFTELKRNPGHLILLGWTGHTRTDTIVQHWGV